MACRFKSPKALARRHLGWCPVLFSSSPQNAPNYRQTECGHQGRERFTSETLPVFNGLWKAEWQASYFPEGMNGWRKAATPEGTVAQSRLAELSLVSALLPGAALLSHSPVYQTRLVLAAKLRFWPPFAPVKTSSWAEDASLGAAGGVLALQLAGLRGLGSDERVWKRLKRNCQSWGETAADPA